MAGDPRPGNHRVLIVEAPLHDDNSRAIPLPELRLDQAALAPATDAGKVLVRVDFSDDRDLQRLTVIDDTLGGVTPALAEGLQQALSLEYGSDQAHRTVAFAVIDVGTSQISDSFVYLPKCCCGEVHCI